MTISFNQWQNSCIYLGKELGVSESDIISSFWWKFEKYWTFEYAPQQAIDHHLTGTPIPEPEFLEKYN